MRMAEDGKEGVDTPPPVAADPKESESKKNTPAAFNLNKNVDATTKGGKAGFNQFDPVLAITGFVSRRFGLVGGLAVVAILASTEGKDIVKALLAKPAEKGTGEVFETENGVEYEDILIGADGEGKAPEVGKLVGMTVEVTIADQTFKKNVAFKYGSKPYQSLVCAGLEEGIESMRVGGRRKLTIPLALAPAGMRLPPGVPLLYDVTLNEVFENYLS